jgi:hypothetical protein
LALHFDAGGGDILALRHFMWVVKRLGSSLFYMVNQSLNLCEFFVPFVVLAGIELLIDSQILHHRDTRSAQITHRDEMSITHRK